MTEEAKDTSLAIFDPALAMVVDLVEKDASQEFDHTTPEGEATLRSWVHRIKGGCGDIEKARKRGKEGLISLGRKIDDRAKELTAPLRAIQAERMKPLDEIGDAKRKAAEAIVEAERVAKVKAEAGRLADLKKREEEVAAKETKIKAAEDAANAKQQEAETTKRETRIAESAAQTAKVGAEQKAERERLAAIAAAHAEQHRLDEIERKRVADVAHREEVESKIFSALWLFLSGTDAGHVLDAIKAGEIPRVTINY